MAGMTYRSLSLLAGLLLTLAGCGAPSAPPGQTSYALSTRVGQSSWNTRHGQGTQLATTHYRIYTTATRSELLGRLPAFMEAAYVNYTELTGLRNANIEKPLPIYMMQTRKEWAALTQQVVGPQAELYLRIQAGGYCYKGVCVFWDIGSVGTYSLASHEGLHQFFGSTLKNRLPSWLEEGLCTVAEVCDIRTDEVSFTPLRNVARFTNLREAIVNGQWIPAQKLIVMDAGDAVLDQTTGGVGYYGQLWALVLFLRSEPQYRQGMEKMIADAYAGTFDQALKLTPAQVAQLQNTGRNYNKAVSGPLLEHYISNDLPKFERQYEAFARKLAGL